MAGFSFLHAADIHLDSPLRGLSRYEGVPAEEVRTATRAALDRLVETAIDRAVDFVVIAGDLYDGDWKDVGTGLTVASAMGRLGRAGIPVFLLTGNHDAESIITRTLPAMTNVRTFSNRKPETHILADLGVALHGQGFARREIFENLASAYPAPTRGLFNIGVLHTALTGYADHAPYAPCTTQELVAKGYDYWALGHVHGHAVLSIDPPIVFPGNLQGRNIRETGPKGAVLVEVEDGRVARHTHLPLDVVRWATVVVDAADVTDVTEMHDRLRRALRSAVDTQADGRPLMVRILIAGATPLDGVLQGWAGSERDQVRAVAAEVSDAIWIEKIVVTTTPPAILESFTAIEGFAELLGGPDDELGRRLQDALRPLIEAHPASEPDSLLDAASRQDWPALAASAASALRSRMGG